MNKKQSIFAKSLALALCALALLCAAQAQQSQTAPQKQEAQKKVNARPAVEATPEGEPFDRATVEKMAAQCVRLETEAGDILIEMLPEAAPESVRNFLNLAATGAFDTTTFSRVVKDFIIQGGDLSTRETLNVALMKRARRTVPDEPNAIKHVRGIVSMARSDQPNSATTHFFILAGTGAHLDGTFAAFGRVRNGMDVVDQINKAPVEGERPVKPVRIRRASVAACPAEEKPKQEAPAETP